MKLFGKPARKIVAHSKLLNLGCGNRFHRDWVNLDFISYSPDIFQFDLRKKLPFEDGVFSAVYHSHVLEHFSKQAAPAFLAECYRVLEPGGILRVVVPDLEKTVRAYLKSLEEACEGDTDAAKRHQWMSIELLDQMVREESGGEMMKYWKLNPMPAEEFVFERVGHEARQFVEEFRKTSAEPAQARKAEASTPHELAKFRETGEIHKWMYDRFSLAHLLQKLGFVDVKNCAASESKIPAFNAYQLDADEHGLVRKPDSLFMEAMKPGK